jgi:hypothetical protein
MTAASPRAIDPLNSVLYAQLEHKFGSISIANEGVNAHIQRFADPLRPGKVVENTLTWGEFYCVNCPFCADNRRRLWINHLYGSEYEHQRRKYTHLAVCYNENCTHAAGRLAQLETIVFGPGRPLFRRVQIKAATAEFVQTAVEPPGEICALGGLPEFHPAVRYVLGRKFDPIMLARDFNIGVCTFVEHKRYRPMLNRLYIPIVTNNELVGWQGRAVTDDAAPKYFNAPGTSKSRMLYNLDTARTQPYVVVVEGVPSVWRIGAAAVCLFGKTMSLYQQTTIATTWGRKPVILMLDRDAKPEMEQGIAGLKTRGMDVRPVFLPDERDPADYSTPEIQAIIDKELG